MPPAIPRINLPQKPLFILTVDTEEEWDWTRDFPRPPFSTQNIEQIPDFQSFCKELDVRPTYFTDYAVVDNDEHAQILKHYFDAGECDIGAHLHPWATPPFEETVNETNSHAVNLPLELFQRKISVLTDKLETTFGHHPYSYRAGRWGINNAHLKILHEHGYRIDSSVRPYYRDQHFSYAKAPTSPYWPSSDDAMKETYETPGIFEVPATSGYNFSNFEQLDKLHEKLSTPPLNRLRLIGILWRLHLLRKITITPEDTDHADICRCIDACINRGDKVINMFFHSSDLLPGCTQYVQSDEDKISFIDTIKRCVEHLRSRHDAQMTTMREIRQQLTGKP